MVKIANLCDVYSTTRKQKKKEEIRKDREKKKIFHSRDSSLNRASGILSAALKKRRGPAPGRQCRQAALVPFSALPWQLRVRTGKGAAEIQEVSPLTQKLLPSSPALDLLAM